MLVRCEGNVDGKARSSNRLPLVEAMRRVMGSTGSATESAQFWNLRQAMELNPDRFLERLIRLEGEERERLALRQPEQVVAPEVREGRERGGVDNAIGEGVEGVC